uniref:Uncharacterized protein n=1 Tax=Panagrolaimus sp. JU765 TaxID=591449 RepID=A0AC34RSA7_9BILA
MCCFPIELPQPGATCKLHVADPTTSQDHDILHLLANLPRLLLPVPSMIMTIILTLIQILPIKDVRVTILITKDLFGIKFFDFNVSEFKLATIRKKSNDQSIPTAQTTIDSVMPSSAHNAEHGNVEADKYGITFKDAANRAGFVRRVFFFITIMFGLIAMMTAIPFFNRDLMKELQDTKALLYASLGTFAIMLFTLGYYESLRRQFPFNLICTVILILSIGYITLTIFSMCNVEFMCLTFVITTIVCATIILFATQTKYDLTSKVGYLFILSMVIVTFGIVSMISVVFFKIRWLHTVYAGIAALLFMLFLPFEIQFERRIQTYNPEDYIAVTIQIFFDIMGALTLCCIGILAISYIVFEFISTFLPDVFL